MIFIGLIMLLMPIFIVVAIWTKLYQKLRCKILLTVIAGFFLVSLISLSSRQTELDEAESSIDYVIERDNDYLDCIDIEAENENFDGMMDNCIIPMVKDLREMYDRE